MQVNLEIPAMDIVLADQLGCIGFVDGGLQALALANILASDIDVADGRAHGEAGIEAAFEEKLRVVPHDLTILASARLRLVSVDDQIGRARVGLGHERPFEARREAGAATAAQAGGLDLVDDPVRALLDETLGAVPGPTPPRARQPPIQRAIEVFEDPVLIGEHSQAPVSSSVRIPLAGAENWRLLCGPGLTPTPDLSLLSSVVRLSGVKSSK